MQSGILNSDDEACTGDTTLLEVQRTALQDCFCEALLVFLLHVVEL